MPPEPPARNPLDALNPAQRAAATHGIGERPSSGPPLLVIAGAGTGKTTTLAHRVAHLLRSGADPRRILLLTFTRRAAAAMTRRAQRLTASAAGGGGAGGRRASGSRIAWSGTFHAIANRLLRLHAASVGLAEDFTILDRGDAADLLNLLRGERGLAKKTRRFPQKGTCLAIYSHTVNAQVSLEDTLRVHFPWCQSWHDELRALFRAYTDAKLRHQILDYDDLLLWWHHLMREEDLARAVRRRFDHVLVDEYQDTNRLQAEILLALCPGGAGLTVVGDDAQAIYSFRAATVRNILDFPSRFTPPAAVLTLEENYRSVQPILDAANAVIDQAPERFTKRLHSRRASAQLPILVTAEDEDAEVDWVVARVLEHREAGIPLRRQAVLFRTSHHSDRLQLELSRRDIPFVVYGGLKFLEAAHVKDLLAVLRWVENPRDAVAAFRMLQLLPGMGPGNARRVLGAFEERGRDFRALRAVRVPRAAQEDWPGLCELLEGLRDARGSWPGQVGRIRLWYQPHLERLHEAPHVRAADLEQLEAIADGYPSRERFLSDLALDPPEASGDEAGPPHLDEDWLVLSTIHSAKGREWDVVFVLHVADGCIPSDMACGTPEQIEEERRLLYVAMTRAKDQLHLVHPLRFFVHAQPRRGDRHVLAPRSRFLPVSILDHFEQRVEGCAPADIASRVRAMWD